MWVAWGGAHDKSSPGAEDFMLRHWVELPSKGIGELENGKS